MSKLLNALAVGGLLLSSATVSAAPAEAQRYYGDHGRYARDYRYDRYDRWHGDRRDWREARRYRWRHHYRPRCWTEWHHHHRVRICR